METSLPVAKINGKVTRGQAHVQPGVNNWIGVCMVTEDLLDKNIEDWSSKIIEYEGPFNCRKYNTNGKGKAKILSVSKIPHKNELIITFEGIEKPQLEKSLKRRLKFSYNENLPVFINKMSRKKEIPR